MRFAFDNEATFTRSTKIGDQEYDWYEWVVFMNEPPEKLDLVKSVEYRLHESFPNPIRTVSDSRSHFALKSRGWGEFTIRISVRLKDGSVVPTKYELDLSKTAGNTRISQ